MLDLTGAKLKTERAKKHICDLDAAKVAFLKTDPYEVTPEFYPEHGLTAYFLDKFTAIPDPIPLLIGDIVHNLRTSLDYVAVALVDKGVALGKEAPTGPTYFPICETFDKYKSQAPRKIAGMICDDVKAIDKIKPYGGGTDLLWALHRLDIIDKHHLLIPATVCVGAFGLEITQGEVESALRNFIVLPEGAIQTQRFWFPMPAANRLIALKRGDPVLSLSGNFEANGKVQLTFDIAFGEPEVIKGKSVLETLQEAADLVEGIVTSFE